LIDGYYPGIDADGSTGLLDNELFFELRIVEVFGFQLGKDGVIGVFDIVLYESLQEVCVAQKIDFGTLPGFVVSEDEAAGGENHDDEIGGAVVGLDNVELALVHDAYLVLGLE